MVCPATETGRYGVAFGDLNHDQYMGAIVNTAHPGPGTAGGSGTFILTRYSEDEKLRVLNGAN